MSVLAEAEFGFIDQFWGEHDKVGSWHLCEWSEPPMACPKLRVKQRRSRTGAEAVNASGDALLPWFMRAHCGAAIARALRAR